MTLLDPDKQSPQDAADMSSEAAAAGTDAIMIGGSTGVTQEKVDATILAIKKAVRIPVILFPASAGNLSPHADAVYFMSLLNSRDPRLIIASWSSRARCSDIPLARKSNGRLRGS